MSETSKGRLRNLSFLCLALGFCLSFDGAAQAESEASFAVGDSQATWGGWSSEARSCARSEARWGTSSSEASSQAGSESGYGGWLSGGGRRRGYWRNYYRGGSANTYEPTGYEASQASAMKRLKQEQQSELNHEQNLAKMPDSSFVHTYGAATPGGVLDTYRRRNTESYRPEGGGSAGNQSYAYGGGRDFSRRQQETQER